MDFTAILQEIDYAPVVASLTAVAAILVLPGVAKWGYNKIIGWFDPDAAQPTDWWDEFQEDYETMSGDELREKYDIEDVE